MWLLKKFNSNIFRDYVNNRWVLIYVEINN